MFDRFFFGCEADDRGVAVAFRAANLVGTQIKTVFGSDIGHWDVPDASEVLPESYELVEDSAIDLDDYQDFVFGDSVRLHGQMNASFFAGTVIEDQACDLLTSAA